jgi:ketosteroid isomerase-like protein
MKRLLIAVVVMALITPYRIFAQASSPATAPVKIGSVEQELMNLEQDWAKAYVQHDLVALGRLEADDIIYTDPDGAIMTKAQDLDDVKSGAFVAASFVVDEMKVSVYGDAAVITGRSTIKAQYKGKDGSGQFRWTDTWIRRHGVWQCVASHASKIAEVTPTPPSNASTVVTP